MMDADRIDRLTESQRSYLRLVLEHRSSKQIAQQFGISAHTVDKRIKEAMRVLGVSTRVEAARILEAGGAFHASPQLGPQSPDLALLPGLATLEPSGGDGFGGHAPSGKELHDEQSHFSVQRGGRFALPFATDSRPHNNLSVLQRAGWMIGLIIGLALATGILLSGLSALSTLIIALKH